jgi:hypothetical protein
MRFLNENHRNPSKHRIEEHDMLNWLKANRKVMNKGEMRPDGWCKNFESHYGSTLQPFGGNGSLP